MFAATVLADLVAAKLFGSAAAPPMPRGPPVFGVDSVPDVIHGDVAASLPSLAGKCIAITGCTTGESTPTLSSSAPSSRRRLRRPPHSVVPSPSVRCVALPPAPPAPTPAHCIPSVGGRAGPAVATRDVSGPSARTVANAKSHAPYVRLHAGVVFCFLNTWRPPHGGWRPLHLVCVCVCLPRADGPRGGRVLLLSPNPALRRSHSWADGNLKPVKRYGQSQYSCPCGVLVQVVCGVLFCFSCIRSRLVL